MGNNVNGHKNDKSISPLTDVLYLGLILPWPCLDSPIKSLVKDPPPHQNNNPATPTNLLTLVLDLQIGCSKCVLGAALEHVRIPHRSYNEFDQKWNLGVTLTYHHHTL